ncbi:MAG: MerR family transcriptional regulator [Chloroflexota bacterium]|nr:MerR family transcriptional regulator [Chloroflexota bacterium]MDE2839311.1 MerR family transcriptional regulator [Chloroflexota bacterium]MDE2931334.1 MerR family transcriptional regulator [Chloroflexota bacterium]
MSAERYLQIGEVAEQLGLTPRTLRYYEEIGLLEPPSRMEGGFRLYSATDIDRLENIVQLKRLLGFSLREIKQVVEAMESLKLLRQESKQASDLETKRDSLRKGLEILERQVEVLDGRMRQVAELRDQFNERSQRVRERLQQIEAELQAVAVNTPS